MASLILVCLAFSAAAQEPQHSPFACPERAVSVEIDRNPPLTFQPLDRKPEVGFEAHEFTFNSAPFGLVRVYLTATLPEQWIGRASQATLSLYVETTASMDTSGSQGSRWWQLVAAAPTAGTYETRASHTLTFDAKQIENCFGFPREHQPKCVFADVSPATTDTNVPLIAIGFKQDQGGANADNWTHARLLLDFRSSPPRVAVTGDCGYNEGGGACTAIDSDRARRSMLVCDWKAGVSDFLCNEQSDQSAHRDFYLLSDRRPPLRPSEVASLEDAAGVLARGRIGETAVVQRVGPVTWVDDVRLDAQRTAMLLRSASAFYVATRSSATLGPVVPVQVRDVLDDVLDPERAYGRAYTAPSIEIPWTEEFAARYRSRELFRDGRLVVLQVVETSGAEPTSTPSAMYWIGIEPGPTGMSADAVRLSGGGAYEQCGMARTPPSVVSVGRLTRPFQARVRVRPAILESEMEDDPVPLWASAGYTPERIECIRNANLQWRRGKFEAAIDDRPCAAPETPRRLHIEPDGRLRLDRPAGQKQQ